MANTTVFSLAAALSLVPAAVASLWGPFARDARFWALAGAAAVGATAWAAVQVGRRHRVGRDERFSRKASRWGSKRLAQR